jgi:hypothetical protein
MPKQISEIKEFLQTARRKDAKKVKVVTIKKGGSTITKFKIRCSKVRAACDRTVQCRVQRAGRRARGGALACANTALLPSITTFGAPHPRTRRLRSTCTRCALRMQKKQRS